MQLDPRKDLYLALSANPGGFITRCGQQPAVNDDALFRIFARLA